MTQTRLQHNTSQAPSTVSATNLSQAVQYLRDLEYRLIAHGLNNVPRHERVEITLGTLRLSELFFVLCISTSMSQPDDTIEFIPLVNVYVGATLRTVTLERAGVRSCDYLVSKVSREHIVKDILCLLHTPWLFY